MPSNSQSPKIKQNSPLGDGLPTFISIGIAPRGIIAIGLIPMGVVAIGGVSMGLFTISAVGMGLVNVCLVGCGLLVWGIKAMGFN